MFSGNRAAGVRVTLWVLLFIPVAAVIRLASHFVMILITGIFIVIVEKPGENTLGASSLHFGQSALDRGIGLIGMDGRREIDIVLERTPQECIGGVLGSYLCGFGVQKLLSVE